MRDESRHSSSNESGPDLVTLLHTPDMDQQVADPAQAQDEVEEELGDEEGHERSGTVCGTVAGHQAGAGHTAAVQECRGVVSEAQNASTRPQVRSEILIKTLRWAIHGKSRGVALLHRKVPLGIISVLLGAFGTKSFCCIFMAEESWLQQYDE